MAKLTIHRREIELDDVAAMPQEDFDNLIRFVKQWADLAEQDNLDKLQEARTKDAKAKVAATEVDEPEYVNEYSNWPVSELKEALEEKGLSTSGNKSELVQRLTDAS